MLLRLRTYRPSARAFVHMRLIRSLYNPFLQPRRSLIHRIPTPWPNPPTPPSHPQRPVFFPDPMYQCHLLALIDRRLLHRRRSRRSALKKSPTLPVEHLCRATSAQNLIPLAAEGDAKAAYDNCMQSERRYREETTKDWANFSLADKQHCVSLVLMGGSASYAELITCLEMAREVRQSKDSSANPQRKQ